MTKPTANFPASVRQRLSNLAHRRREDFAVLLTKHALERLLFRIGRSPYREMFVLKGALLFELWTEEAHRPTRDADLLSYGSRDPERFRRIFQELAIASVEPDGLEFNPETVVSRVIKEGADYEGVRVTMIVNLDRARIPVQIDIAFGDSVTPGPVETEYPTLLEGSRPTLLAYPKETVVAEKFEAIVKLGIANTRMKDLHDLRVLAQLFFFRADTLSRAIHRTFERRKTVLPVGEPPLAFTPEFYDAEDKKKQWSAFNTKNRLYIQPDSLQGAMSELNRFLMPLVNDIGRDAPGKLALETQRTMDFPKRRAPLNRLQLCWPGVNELRKRAWSFGIQEVLRSLAVNLSELQQLRHIDATVPSLTLREKRVSHDHLLGYVSLSQTGVFSCGD